MKPSQIFHRYIWIINTLRAFGQLTLEQISQKWQHDAIADGNHLPRTSFNRYRDAILDMFGIIIECDERTHRYYISNARVLTDDSVGRWLFSTLTVHGVLADGAAVKDRLVLENVPAGEDFLPVIIQGIKSNSRIRMGYRKFSGESYEKTVCPYALKLFHQRWYLLARTPDDQMRTYALDRMTMAEPTSQTFDMPPAFSPQNYFSEYFGVLTDGTPLAHVILRAHSFTPHYLRTLPLHHSQCEIATTDHYADFAYDLRPTADFLGQLLTHGPGIEVLAPEELRQKMHQQLKEALKNYEK